MSHGDHRRGKGLHEQDALNLLADVVEHLDRDALTLQPGSGKLDETFV